MIKISYGVMDAPAMKTQKLYSLIRPKYEVDLINP